MLKYPEIKDILVITDIDLFCKMTKAHHCAHSLLSNLVHTISDPKGTHMSYLGVIQRCIKTHLYPVAFIGTYV